MISYSSWTAKSAYSDQVGYLIRLKWDGNRISAPVPAEYLQVGNLNLTRWQNHLATPMSEQSQDRCWID